MLSGIGDLKERSVVIYKLKEQDWTTSLGKYELTKTKGIVLVIVAPCPTPVNDKIENAIVLNQGTLCSNDSYSLLYASIETNKKIATDLSDNKDVWFKMQTNAKKEMVELMIKRPNSGTSNPFLEAYNIDMEPMKTYQEESASQDHFFIENYDGDSEFYIRAFDIDRPNADPFQICRVMHVDLNDDCDKAIEVKVLKSCEWLGVQF
ncbi:MAG: hypothetical protein ACI9FN_002218 [Saprospiraceae bacterium]